MLQIYVVHWSLLLTKTTAIEIGTNRQHGCAYGCELFYNAEDAIAYSQ